MTVTEMNNNINPRMFGMNPMEAEVEKDTKKEEVDSGNKVVDSTDKLILNLNNITIASQITAVIANKNSGELVINLVENTTNVLKDNGSSEYDACIYSKGNLTIGRLKK